MIGDLKPQKLVYRDGVSQSQRLSSELDPTYIDIEERNVADFVVFAKEFAKYLRFYHIDNKTIGSWEGFLNDAPTSVGADQWLNNLLGYADDAAPVDDRPENSQAVANPHVALFITFLKLLGHIKTQLNQLTKQHLDLYYQELLGLTKNRRVADVVNIIVELGSELDSLLLEKGTRLTAGKDSEGKELIYETQKDTLITKAVVANVKTMFVDQQPISLAEHWNKDDVSGSISNMLNMALDYDAFNADVFVKQGHVLDNELISQEALKYQLTDDDLGYLVKLVTDNTQLPDETKILTILNSAHQLRLIHKKRLALADPSSIYALLSTTLGTKNALPNYDGRAVKVKTLDVINDDTSGDDLLLKAKALAYIRMLQLTVVEFGKLIAISHKPIIEDSDWAAVYAILANALEKKGITNAVKPVTRWKDISINADVKTTSTDRFQTFGDTNGTIINNNTALGFAISSPHFALSEGERTIDLYLSLTGLDLLKSANLKKALELQQTISPPFRYFISTDEGWEEITGKNIMLADHLVASQAVDIPGASISNKGTAIATQRPYFDGKEDLGKYVIWTDGTVYKIDIVNNRSSVGVSVLGKTSVQTAVKMYQPTDVSLNVLHITLNIDGPNTLQEPPPAIPDGLLRFKATPILALALNNAKKVDNAFGIMDWYQQLNGLLIQKVKTVISVKGLKALSLQNEYGRLNPKTPIEPFGPRPKVGSRFYFSHPELSRKKIDSLNLNFDWMNAPKDFQKYYADYRKVYNGELSGSNKVITGNDYFEANLKVITDERPEDLNNVKLFTANEAKLLPSGQHLAIDEPHTTDDVINWQRYFMLELLTDFNDAAYPLLIVKQFQDENKKGLNLSMPYIPKLKGFTVDYTTSFELAANQKQVDGQLFNISAFGYENVDFHNLKNAKLVPTFANAGELFIGISGLAKQENLAILFQMAEGTANPDLSQPTITWSYLSNNQWHNFNATEILTDTTRGLLNTGIIEFKIPSDISNVNTLFQENLYWLRASVVNDTTAVADTISVIAQGVSAKFIDQDNAASHFTTPLQPESIKKTLEAIAGIKKIQQPFASINGMPAETDPMFYMRISERIRHKNRAQTLWDYERLILNQFPDIYKVKCMPGNFLTKTPDNLGKVDIIVLPNIKGKLAFDIFQPKVPSDVLLQITEYLEERIPPFVSVTVRNPVYVMLEVRTGVRIKQGLPEKFYQAKLEEDLKKFLSPWAYDADAEIIIGGSVHSNIIVNFIAKLPYIDHVATIRLSQSIAGGAYKPLDAADPHTVFISASNHDIILLEDDEHESEQMAGINYMEIQHDFIIPNTNRQSY